MTKEELQTFMKEAIKADREEVAQKDAEEKAKKDAEEAKVKAEAEAKEKAEAEAIKIAPVLPIDKDDALKESQEVVEEKQKDNKAYGEVKPALYLKSDEIPHKV